MPYYHVQLYRRVNWTPETQLDVDEATLERDIVEPYRRGLDFVINGRIMRRSDLEKIKITSTDLPSGEIMKMLEENGELSVRDWPGRALRVVETGKDVTGQFVVGPLGGRVDQGSLKAAPPDPAKVFL